MVTDVVCTILAPAKRTGIRRIVSPLGVRKFGAKCNPLNLSLISTKPLKRIRPNFNRWPLMVFSANHENLVNIALRIRLCGAFICRNFVVTFSFCSTNLHIPFSIWAKIEITIDTRLSRFSPAVHFVRWERSVQRDSRHSPWLRKFNGRTSTGHKFTLPERPQRHRMLIN